MKYPTNCTLVFTECSELTSGQVWDFVASKSNLHLYIFNMENVISPCSYSGSWATSYVFNLQFYFYLFCSLCFETPSCCKRNIWSHQIMAAPGGSQSMYDWTYTWNNWRNQQHPCKVPWSMPLNNFVIYIVRLLGYLYWIDVSFSFT